MTNWGFPGLWANVYLEGLLLAWFHEAGYRSGKPLHPITPKAGVLGAPALRHPKARVAPVFSASCEAVPYPKPFMRPVVE